MARKTKEDSQRTRDTILDAAEKVFLDKGVSAATMADIADAAGVSRGAIYGHYSNKIEVCIAMCMRALAPSEKCCEAKQGVSALQQTYDMLYQFLRQYGESGSLQRVLEILHLKCEDCEENRAILEFREEWRAQGKKRGEQFIRLAIVQGELPPDQDIDLSLIFVKSLMTGLCDALFWSEKARRPKWKDAERILRTGILALQNSVYLRS